MRNQTDDSIVRWFLAAEELGEFIGIRFGQLPRESQEPQWIFLRHAHFDGIGGLADILRRRGANLARLPQIKHPSRPSWLPLLRTLPRFLSPRHRIKWRQLDGASSVSTSATPPAAVATHAFDELATTRIRRVCRKAGVTVNSFLVKHLTKAIRPFLEDQSSIVPWMIPVNLRGKVDRARDTVNHTSYVGIKVRSYETVRDVHQSIYHALARGEHWANWYSYRSSFWLTPGMRRYLITTERCMSQWNLGSFSNLGDWDPEKRIGQADCAGLYAGLYGRALTPAAAKSRFA